LFQAPLSGTSSCTSHVPKYQLLTPLKDFTINTEEYELSERGLGKNRRTMYRGTVRYRETENYKETQRTMYRGTVRYRQRVPAWRWCGGELPANMSPLAIDPRGAKHILPERDIGFRRTESSVYLFGWSSSGARIYIWPNAKTPMHA
jgi:hypothetical protein